MSSLIKISWNLPVRLQTRQDFEFIYIIYYKWFFLGFYTVFLKQRSRSLLFIKKIAGFSPFPIPRANYLWELADESPD